MTEMIDYKKYPILFVDDETDVLTTMVSVLEESFTVESTNKPEEALKMVNEKEYAVILSDQRMPKMNGFELLSEVKKISPYTYCKGFNYCLC